MFRRIAATSTAVVASLGIALSVNPTAHAAPIDVQFLLPTFGVTAAPPYMLSSAAGGWVIAQTDAERPGMTRFISNDAGYCFCSIQWRNLSTGATGVAQVGLRSTQNRDYVPTGSGVLVASVGIPGTPSFTLLPGAGVWTVP
ncbi:hypothetical protein JWS13_37750 [Rhodococcus pseudokoreensis]|uniref:Secreted protein n=1 Tax=Rhodococcus pseudokoreensis TaxID=2811421 RepID=A0A974ZXF9_9NOCA|nr:hypothetical protein [Rhodococcus pseudokoreensis]QSE93940.1 hypothetical protein JWS13_37750 [Rhodococcus pseudokoreensis]